MVKKKRPNRTRKADAKRARRSRPRDVGGGPRRPGSAHEQLRNLAGPFRDWFLHEGPGVHAATPAEGLQEAEAAVAAASDVLGMLEQVTGRLDVTDVPPESLEMLLVDLLPAVPDLDEDVVPVIAATFLVYLSFLAETGRWTGSPEALDDCLEIVADVLEETEQVWPGLPDIEPPDVAANQELAALAALPLLEQLRALVRWLGQGRRVTGTGAIRTADLPSAAAVVGVSGPVVRSMWDVPELAALWTSAADAGLLDVGSTWARPTERVVLLDDGEDAERLALLRAVVADYVATRVVNSDQGRTPWSEHVPAAVVAAIIQSMLGHPLDPGGLQDGAQEALGDLPHHAAEPVVRQILDEVEALRGLGLLTPGGAIDVPDPLKPAIARALQLLAGAGDADEDGQWPDAGGGSAALQLKIALKGSRPPVWRRVLVPADIRLADLHHVIQACFGWDDDHLHRFTVGEPYRADTVYEPADEARVRLRDLASSVGDKVSYLYDFGDDWLHEITVEEHVEAGEAQLPTLLGGRGRSPFEDSGGVHGWAALVEAAADPAHPGHTEARDWLGLVDDEALDPRAFDRAPVDTRLAALRLRR